MDRKILAVGILAGIFSLASVVYAVGPNGGGAAVNQTQQQTRTVNQGAGSQLQVQTTEQSQSGSALEVREQRKSQVAEAVQEMLRVAERNGGIGQQVKVIAQTQNQNQEKVEADLAKIQNRNKLVRFLVGPDYRLIKNTQQTLEQNHAQIEQLNQLKTELHNLGDSQVLAAQIKLLEQANTEISKTLESSHGRFSLLGWMFRILAR